MTAILAALFMTGVPLSGQARLVLMLPLCLSIAIAYKTMRCETLREVPAAALALWVTIVVGMYAVGFGLWAVFELVV